MRRNSILGALASVAGLKAAERLATAATPRRVIRRPPPAPAVHTVGAFTMPYKRNPDQKGPRPSHTYRWARRKLAKLIRKGREPGATINAAARAG
jgi:hypothetical protein